MMQQAPWERFGGAPPASAPAQSAPEYIPGPPRLPAPQTAPQVQQDINSAANSGASAARTTALTPLEVQKARADAHRAEIEADNAARAAQLQQQQQGTVEDAQQEIRNVIDAARRAQELSRAGGVSGRDRWVGNVTRVIGGTALNDLEGALDTVRSNIAFTRLQRMRQESPTGGAVGNVSDSDLRLLASTIASLDRSQSDEVFEGNLQRVIDSYQRVYDRLAQGGEGTAQRAATDRAHAAVAPGLDATVPPDPNGPQSPDPGAEGAARALSAPTGGPPPPPNDGITRTDPRESGLVAGVTQQPNQEIAGSAESGTMYAGPLSQRFVSEWQNAVNQGATREQLNALLQRQSEQLTQAYHMLAPLFPGISLGPQIPTSVPDDMWRMIEEGRRTNRMPNWGPNPIDPQPGSGMGRMLGDSGTAAVSNALDSASFGLPALVSEDFRNRLGNMREHHPVASTVGALVGGIVAPGGPRPGMSLLEQSGRSAAQGAAYGFNESGGDPENALVGGAIGLAAPGAVNLAGRVVRPVVNALSRAPVTPAMQAVAQAAEQERVPISRPVVDPSVRDRMAYLESSPGSGNAIRTPLQATREAIEGRAGELQGPGTVQPNGVVGQQVQDAADRYIRRSGDIRTRLYDRAAQIAGDAPVQGQEAVKAIDEALAELAPNAPVNQGQISYLQNLRRTFVDEQGNLIPRTVQSIRDLRTEMRGHIDNGTLTRGPAERRVLNVLGAARQDIERDLGAQNPAAVRAYQRADRFNAERASEIRQVVQRVIGRSDDRLSGEQVMTRLRTMAGNGGDADRLRRLWDKLSPEEQADAVATIASTAGRKSAEEGFEPGQFVAWSRTLSPEARQVIFGPQGAQSIANLRVLSKALMDTTSRFNNSRSGVVANWGRVFRDVLRGGPVGAGLGLVAGGSALASGGAGLALGGASAVAGTMLRKLSARALMNPDMSRWLAGATRASTPSAIRQHIARLAVVERANPALTQEITGLRQALLNAVNDNVLPATGRAAASPDEGPDHE